MKVDSYSAWALRVSERIANAMTWANFKLLFGRKGPQ